ncbi:MAG: hypothetical protein WAT71_07450 [Ignavibacteria bacterium]
MESTKKIDLKNELFRKGIHLFSSIIPIAYIFFGSREFFIWFLSVQTILMIAIDYYRFKHPGFQGLFMKIFGNILRSHEVGGKKAIFTGGTYLVFAFLICVIVFPKPVAVMSMLVLVFSDTFAAFSGKIFGKTKIGNKTLEGSIGFFVSGMIIVLLTPKITDTNAELVIATITLFLTTAFELIPLKIDDNFTIPMFFGITYLILFNLFI